MTKGRVPFRRFGPEHVISLGVCDACYRGHPEACSCTWEQIVFGGDLTVGVLRCEVDPRYRGVKVLRTQVGLPDPDPAPRPPRHFEKHDLATRLRPKKREPDDFDLSDLDAYTEVVAVVPVVACIGGRRYALGDSAAQEHRDRRN